MSSYYLPPPSASEFLRNSVPDLPEEGEYTSESLPPTFSTGYIGNSQQQFRGIGQPPEPDVEYVTLPPQQTAVRQVLPSSNHLSGDSNRLWVEASGGGGSLSGSVHKNNSVYGVTDPYGTDGEAPGHSKFALRDRTSNGTSANDLKFDPRSQAGFSMVGNKFKLANQELNQYDSIAY